MMSAFYDRNILSSRFMAAALALLQSQFLACPHFSRVFLEISLKKVIFRYGAVKYHLQHLEYLKVFAAEEGNRCGWVAPDSLKLIQDMLTCSVELLTLKAEISFIVQHSQAFVQATDAFQSQKPIAVKVCLFGIEPV